jgi:nitrite reductase/ring-hydroxylating ferredoxin subunit/DMSO/TMAO reductase YedYZ heme-binding membrane subunit
MVEWGWTMSVSYTWVGWNRQKRIYDAVVAGAVGLYLVVFVVITKAVFRPPREISTAIVFIRALGTCAIVMLHVVLCIGPLVRLNPRLLPLLYNRRHLGVMTFLVGLAHAALAIAWYHGSGNVNPLVSLLASNTNYLSITEFPFEMLGLAALFVLFLMAVTSHDFWLKNLSARTWKNLHMLVYLAYGLLVLHVALGALQAERSPIYPALLGLGVVTVSTLHIAAGRREVRRDATEGGAKAQERWIDAGSVDEIPEKRAKVFCPAGARGARGAGERIAIFRYDGKVSAVSNVCEHQGGPLGEGKIVGGCITCPWHGYQYLPESGCSPPPFTEKINTYRVTIRGRRILIDPEPLPKGTPVEPAPFEEAGS